MCGEYIAILAERQIALFGNKWVLNNNCNLSSWFHVDIMCYIKHTHVFIFQSVSISFANEKVEPYEQESSQLNKIIPCYMLCNFPWYSAMVQDCYIPMSTWL